MKITTLSLVAAAAAAAASQPVFAFKTTSLRECPSLDFDRDDWTLYSKCLDSTQIERHTKLDLNHCIGTNNLGYVQDQIDGNFRNQCFPVCRLDDTMLRCACNSRGTPAHVVGKEIELGKLISVNSAGRPDCFGYASGDV